MKINLHVLLLLLILVASCGPTDKQKQDLIKQGYNKGFEEAKDIYYKLGYQNGEEIGYKKGYEAGYKVGTGKFIEESWKPTLGFTLILFLLVSLLLPIGFILKRKYESQNARSISRKYLHSSKNIQLIDDEHTKLLASTQNLIEIKTKTLDFLTSEIDHQNECTDKGLSKELQKVLSEFHIRALKIEGNLLLLEQDIKNTLKYFTKERQNNYKAAIKDIAKDTRIEPTEKTDLYKTTFNFYKSKYK